MITSIWRWPSSEDDIQYVTFIMRWPSTKENPQLFNNIYTISAYIQQQLCILTLVKFINPIKKINHTKYWVQLNSIVVESGGIKMNFGWIKITRDKDKSWPKRFYLAKWGYSMNLGQTWSNRVEWVNLDQTWTSRAQRGQVRVKRGQMGSITANQR